jgi:hypothetical protein
MLAPQQVLASNLPRMDSLGHGRVGYILPASITVATQA